MIGKGSVSENLTGEAPEIKEALGDCDHFWKTYKDSLGGMFPHSAGSCPSRPTSGHESTSISADLGLIASCPEFQGNFEN